MASTYERQFYLRLEGAGCDRGGRAVLRGVSLLLAPGEAVQLYGANGAGKTSLLTMLAGAVKLAEGAIHWREGGEASEWKTTPPAGDIVFIGHETSIKPALSVRENLRFWAKSYGCSRAEAAIGAALERMQLDALIDAPAIRLSAGQRRRVDLARALIAERAVWLMDEPAAAMDAQATKLLHRFVGEHQARGGMAVIATHDAMSIDAKRLVIG